MGALLQVALEGRGIVPGIEWASGRRNFWNPDQSQIIGGVKMSFAWSLVVCLWHFVCTPQKFLRGDSFPGENDVVSSTGSEDRSALVRQALQLVMQFHACCIRKNFLPEKSEGSESDRFCFNFLQTTGDQAGVEFTDGVQSGGSHTRFAQGETFQHAAETFSNWSERRKISRVQPVIEAPPIVRRGDQATARAENSRYFQDCFVE